jgi:uncharacterized protein YjbI with pentapeptide repeats
LRGRVNFSRSAQAHDALALLHEARQVFSRGVGVSLSGATLLAEASLRGAKLSGTSLSGSVMLAGSSLYGASLGGTLGLADASLRGASLRDILLLAGALMRGASLAESAANGTKKVPGTR